MPSEQIGQRAGNQQTRECTKCGKTWINGTCDSSVSRRALCARTHGGQLHRQRQAEMTTARCYLCGERRPKEQTEVARHVVPSAGRGGTVQGVARYVRMCSVGHGCKATP